MCFMPAPDVSENEGGHWSLSPFELGWLAPVWVWCWTVPPAGPESSLVVVGAVPLSEPAFELIPSCTAASRSSRHRAISIFLCLDPWGSKRQRSVRWPEIGCSALELHIPPAISGPKQTS